MEITPLTLDFNSDPFKDKVLLDITELVAVTPLIVVVKVLPDRDWVKELIIDLIPDETPLIIFSKKLPVVEATFELMILVLVDTPFIELVKVFPVDDKVFDKVFHVGIPPDPLETNICPDIPSSPFGENAPLNINLPLSSILIFVLSFNPISIVLDSLFIIFCPNI